MYHLFVGLMKLDEAELSCLTKVEQPQVKPLLCLVSCGFFIWVGGVHMNVKVNICCMGGKGHCSANVESKLMMQGAM